MYGVRTMVVRTNVVPYVRYVCTLGTIFMYGVCIVEEELFGRATFSSVTYLSILRRLLFCVRLLAYVTTDITAVYCGRVEKMDFSTLSPNSQPVVSKPSCSTVTPGSEVDR